MKNYFGTQLNSTEVKKVPSYWTIEFDALDWIPSYFSPNGVQFLVFLEMSHFFQFSELERKNGAFQKKHGINFKTEKEPKMKFFDFGALKINALAIT